VSSFECRERDDISARNYTGLMDKSLRLVTNMRCEPLAVTFSKQTAVSEKLIEIIIVNVIRIRVIISMIYRTTDIMTVSWHSSGGNSVSSRVHA